MICKGTGWAVALTLLAACTGAPDPPNGAKSGGADSTATAPAPVAPGAVDAEATRETRGLVANLRSVAEDQVLFGHQDDLAYGVEWWDEPGGSDVRAVTGAYPAVFGWEIGRLEQGGSESLDRVPFDRIRAWMVQAYELGAVNTVSWHADNPVSGGDAWDTRPAVSQILPGGPGHALFRGWLDRLADFFLDVRAPDGELVPIVFRPYHEMSGSWFWWGADSTTPEDYQALWRFTVEYLRDERGVHNLLYAYSTAGLGRNGDRGYWTWYPGDAYVDVLGFDYYAADVSAVAPDLAWLAEHAGSRGKIAAFTETGFEGIPDPDWWTGELLEALTGEPGAERVAWVLVWRNANAELDRPGHFFAPYPGQASAESFVAFKKHPLTLFADGLPDLYRADGS